MPVCECWTARFRLTEVRASLRIPFWPAPGRMCAHCVWPMARTKCTPKLSRSWNSGSGVCRRPWGTRNDPSTTPRFLNHRAVQYLARDATPPSAPRRRITTVELKINYFLPVTEGRIFARSHLLRIGSTLCVGNVDLTDEHGRAIGTAIVTYMFINPPAIRTSDPGPQPACRVLCRVLVVSRVPHAGSSSSCCSSRVNLFDRVKRCGKIERRHQCRLSWKHPIP